MDGAVRAGVDVRDESVAVRPRLDAQVSTTHSLRGRHTRHSALCRLPARTTPIAGPLVHLLTRPRSHTAADDGDFVAWVSPRCMTEGRKASVDQCIGRREAYALLKRV